MPETITHEAPRRQGPGAMRRGPQPPSEIIYDYLSEDDCNDENEPLVMSITNSGVDLVLTHPVENHNESVEGSAKHAIITLIAATETHCRIPPSPDRTFVRRQVLISAYPPIVGAPPILDYNLHRLIFYSHMNFLERSFKHYENYICQEGFRFKDLLIVDRNEDLYYNIFLKQLYDCGRHYHYGPGSHSPNCLMSLHKYLERKLDISLPLTPLDLFMVANAYHAELYFYRTHQNSIMGDGLRHFKFVSRCFYNSLVVGQPRPIWIIIQDGTGCLFPVRHQINDSMFYMYKHRQLSTVLVDRARSVDANTMGTINNITTPSAETLTSPEVIDIDDDDDDA